LIRRASRGGVEARTRDGAVGAHRWGRGWGPRRPRAQGRRPARALHASSPTLARTETGQCLLLLGVRECLIVVRGGRRVTRRGCTEPPGPPGGGALVVFLIGFGPAPRGGRKCGRPRWRRPSGRRSRDCPGRTRPSRAWPRWPAAAPSARIHHVDYVSRDTQGSFGPPPHRGSFREPTRHVVPGRVRG